MGIDYEFLCFEDHNSTIERLTDTLKEDTKCLALSFGTLATIYKNKDIADHFKSLLREKESFIFIYCISPDSSESEVLSDLTDGNISSVSFFSNNNYKYKVSENFVEICKQFSGLSFGPIDNNIDSGFRINKQESTVDNLVTINGRPLFLRTRNGKCSIFMLATTQIINVQDDVVGSIKPREYFSRIIPIMMFLRYVFGNLCWHNSNSQACLIIDDPLLRRKYGCLDYKQLLEAMDHSNFFTAIAFIPWNFRRTSKDSATLFKDRPDKYSLCVHGCDHTRCEFDSIDYREIDYKVKQATKRMELHNDMTGLVFDKVMVFPHEVFSANSMRVLKSNNYLAAVSALPPNNGSIYQKFYNLLQPANMSFENFPLYNRIQLENDQDKVVDFASNLFLGKPLIIYVHHDYFREGYEQIIESVKNINSLAGNIQWKRLGDIIKSSYLQKSEGNNTIRIKQYANNLIISNNSSDVMKYIVSKEETGDISIEHILLNGKKISYEMVDKTLNIAFEIKPKQTAEINIVYRNMYHGLKEKSGIGNNLRIYMRRHLSEIRDDYIGRNQSLLSVVNKLGRFMP